MVNKATIYANLVFLLEGWSSKHWLTISKVKNKHPWCGSQK